jgi:CubicO group peptidase (beta-lactamase class C family)
MRRTPRPVLLLLLLVSALPAWAAATPPATDAELTAQIDQLLARTYPAAEPGAAVLVEKDGKVLLRKGYGMANLELGVPIAPEMVFRLGSITKQFTALAILKLAEQGKLALSDDLTKYLPDFPTHGQTITLEHLLTHTSGIKSYTSLPEWRKTIRQDLTPQQVVDLFKNEPADFAPGEKMLYDNSGYFLLGMVIEKVTGKAYGDWLAETIFTPLGMTHTSYGADAPIIPGRVAGYEGEPGHYRNAGYLSMTQPYAAGSLISTVDDLALWERALFLGTLVKKELFDRMVTPYRLKSGKSTGYGYGLALWSFEGHRVIEHGGGINGFSTELLRLPEDRIVVVVLSNNPAHEPGPDFLGIELASILIGKSLEARKPVHVDPAILDRYVGVYRIDAETTRVVTRQGDRLFTQRLPGGTRNEALPASPTDFFYRDSVDHLHFQTGGSGDRGKVTGMTMESHGDSTDAVRTNDPLPAEKKSVAVAPALLAGLVGDYRLGSDFDIVVTREGEHLYAQATGQPRHELFATSPEEFFLKEVDAALTFHRGPDGKATEVVLHQGGRDFPGKRVK